MPSPIVSTFLPIITLATLLLLNNALLAIAFTWNVSPSISTVSGILKFTGLLMHMNTLRFLYLLHFL